MLRRLAPAALTLVALAGCGGAESTRAPDELVPAGAALYAEVTLAPEGDQKDAVEAIVSKCPGSGDAGERLGGLMERAFRESDSKLSFKRDVEPWLGDRAAAYASVGREGSDGDGAALIATEDEDAALEAVEKAAGGKAREVEYQGVNYRRYPDDTSAGVHDGFLVVGSDAGFRRVVDSGQEDGRKLADDEEYTMALEDADEDRLGTMYVDLGATLKSLEGLGAAALTPFGMLFESPYFVTAAADEGGVNVDSTLPASIPLLFGRGTDLLPKLPGDSWAAFGQPDLGKTLDGYLDMFASFAGGRDQIASQLKRQTGLDLDRDVIGWMGDFGVFVRGTSESRLGGALVIETSDEAASGRALKALQRAIRREGEATVAPLPGGGFTARDEDTPKPFHFVQRSGRVVIAYGAESVRDAARPGEQLSASRAFSAASEGLGEGYVPSTFVAIPPILELADSEGASSDSGYEQAKPYLEALGAVVSGTRDADGKLRSRTRITVP